MRFHQGERFGLSEEEQSLIYWFCRNINRISAAKAKTIEKLIEETAESEEEKEILREALCTNKSLLEISMKRYISESALQRKCEKFYKKAAKVLL